MILDMTNVQQSSGYIGYGEHLVHIFDIKPETSSSGKGYLVITFKDEAGQTIRSNFFTTPEALWRLKKLAVCAGVDAPQLDTDMLLGQRVIITVTKEEKDGKEYHNVKLFAPAPANSKPAAKPAKPAKAKPEPFTAPTDEDGNDPF